MQRIILVTMSALLFVVWQAPVLFAASKNVCLSCHTNDKMMKMLYKPPAMAGGEGEG